MATGKIEYAPDYKSKSQVKRIAAQQGNTITRTNALITDLNKAEHERLCSTLVEADKAERLLTFECLPLIDDLNNHDKHKARFDAWDQAQQARLDAVDALLKFEASHSIGQKDG